MSNETLQALAALSLKLGVTTEYLWSVLLKQASIAAITDVITIAVTLGISLACTSYMRKRPRHVPKNAYDDDTAEILLWAGCVIVILITALTVGVCLTDAINAVFNPEYWALKQIIK